MNNKILEFSSISKKVFMALAGLFLIVFLLVHLTINLFLLLNDGGKLFTASAHFMSTNPVIKVFEIFLFGGFILHIIIGILLTLKNWASRPVAYNQSNQSKTAFFSKYMIWTGLIVFTFLAIHMMNFYFVKLGFVQPPAGLDKHEFYQMVILLFNNKVYSAIYIVLILTLGFHLNHAFKAAFQTLGLNHNKYNCTIGFLGTAYSIIVAGGFIIIPIYFMFFA